MVSDTGIGIAPDFLPHVFERFRQADAGTTRSTGGLGLGLSIVRNIVEMHGGSVHVASEGTDRGATFRVRLPMMIVAPEGLAEPREHPLGRALAPISRLGNLTGIHVLAIDDEEDSLALLRAVLETAGAEVTTASSAVDGAGTHRERSNRTRWWSISVCPEMDGLEFIARLRNSRTPPCGTCRRPR